MGINCTKGQRQDPLENIKYVPNLGKIYFTPKFFYSEFVFETTNEQNSILQLYSTFA